ncbi:MAG: aminopeptidase N, partial [Candidatus Riflebacteria bacterium]|nr:aminopeptidase N [Candidatus Riflebacteria bacterium]
MNRNEASWVSLCLGVTALAGLLAPAVAAATTVDLLTETEARARAAQVSDVSEDVTLTFTAGSRSFGGAAVLRFRLAGTGSALRLDFKGPAPKRLSVNGANLELPDHDGNRLLLPAAALRIGPNVVEVGYENPYDTSGVGVCHIVDPADGREYVYTDFEPFNAHRLLPCFDQPDLKARFRVTIEAPADWVAVANGPESARAPASGGAVAHRFEPTPSLSTYLLFVGAGPYAVFSDPHCAVPSRLFARQSMKGHVDTRELFELIRHGLDFYREYFGMAYPFAKYDQLFLPEFNTSAMENPGAVTFNERFLFRHAPTTKERMERAEIVLHEMAHMWFGNLVTMRWWDGLWLNESFATYVGNLALARATRYKDAFEEFLTVQKSEAYRKDQLPTTHPVAGTVADTNAAFDSFDDITYGKGASLLKQLAF